MSLILKEFLLVKKIIPIALIMLIIFPVFLSRQIGEGMSMIVFYLIIIVFLIMLSGTASQNESKYEKAYAYLSTTPYSRGQLAGCKYVFDYIVFIILTLIYSAEAFVVPQYVHSVKVVIIAAAFISVCFLRGIMIPLEFKFGYEKTKYMTSIVIMLVCFGIPLLIKNTGIDFANNSFFDFFFSLPDYVLDILLFAVGILMSIVSYIISLSIFQNKEL